MTILDIIETKVAGQPLSEAAITHFVHGYTHGKIPDYQIAALLMAIRLRGMNEAETAWLTQAMVSSGDTVDLSGIDGVTVDKHSTGGVGDKTSLVVGPIVASLGLKLAKMSGRGLGHTGGTIDKLESIPGLTTALGREQFKTQVNQIGIAIIGQTQELVPADKKLYALRDVTGTVQSIPLIAASIMSKKIASGARSILLDVKFGNGAFMKTLDEAKVLARAMVRIGRQLGRDTRAMLTDMDQPLGYAIGNRLEVIEAIQTLKNIGPEDFSTLCKQASAMMLIQGKVSESMPAALSKVDLVLTNGKAFEKFQAMIAAQGGNLTPLNDPNFVSTQFKHEILAKQAGFISRINALVLGQQASLLGAGRLTKEDSIDPNAGMMLRVKVGQKVLRGQPLIVLYSNQPINASFIAAVENAFHISTQSVQPQPIVHDWILE